MIRPTLLAAWIAALTVPALAQTGGNPSDPNTRNIQQPGISTDNPSDPAAADNPNARVPTSPQARSAPNTAGGSAGTGAGSGTGGAASSLNEPSDANIPRDQPVPGNSSLPSGDNARWPSGGSPSQGAGN